MTGSATEEPSSQDTDRHSDGEPDLETLRARYRAERDRRLEAGRSEAPDLVGSLASYLDDPHNEPLPRVPVTDDVTVTIVGGGFGGLLIGAALRNKGVDSIRLIDKAGGVGGTWYWNRYPGVRCDIESYIYMPLLEELGYIPSERYAPGAEILRHAENIAARYNLTEGALFHTSVTAAVWQEDGHQWLISTDRGDEFRTRFIIGAIGFLSTPKLSAIPGLKTFPGRSFHTSRWDYSYTGGNSDGNLEKLRDKLVGVVGTGSSAIQVIPHVAASAKHLYVFQRTPAAVGRRDNRKTDSAWARTLAPGWQRRRMENFTALTMGEGAEIDMVRDGFSEVFQSVLYQPRADAIAAGLSPEAIKEMIELADARMMDKVRQRIAAIVRDPDTAEALKPYFYYLCKRPCFHDEYLDTFNRPNVTLVHSPRGVEGIRENRVIADGREFELDLLVYSTGFETSWETGPTYCRRAGFEIYGTGGRSLTEKWQAGTQTFHGIMSAGFPNLFFMPSGIATSVRTPNHMHTLTENAQHIAYIVREVLARDSVFCEPHPDREAEWVQYVVTQSADARPFWESCTPGRFNGEGKIVTLRRQDISFVDRPLEFFRCLAKWRADGRLEGLSFRS
jgi:cyclohexanone monooxygenase